jgi:hypothetical protein
MAANIEHQISGLFLQMHVICLLYIHLMTLNIAILFLARRNYHKNAVLMCNIPR